MSGTKPQDHAPMRFLSSHLTLLLCLGVFAACSVQSGATGARCSTDSDCEANLCYASLCMVPDDDLDGDGLTNMVESSLGTDAQSVDSDGDGIPDAEEIGGDPAQPRDSDGDYRSNINQRHDANESALADTDGDCITDQFDAADEQTEVDLDRVAALSCRQLGVCGAAAAHVVATCQAGGLACDYSGVPGWEEVEASCDASDNDCDGAVDEGLNYPTGDGTLTPIGEPCVGVGVCQDDVGIVECGLDGSPMCSTSAYGSDSAEDRVEVPCNGLDDDCDGVTDGVLTYTSPVDGLPLSVGQPCTSPGMCQSQPGVVACIPGAEEAVCSTGPGGQDDVSQPELCNGIDDDCDGALDEGLVYEPPDGGPARALGESCGVAETPCAEMVVACMDGSPMCCLGTEPCQPWSEVVQDETCDGSDNDCDGFIDEGAGMASECAGAGGVCATSDLVVGICESVDGAMELSCDYTAVEGWEAVEARCDGLDNDCDGHIDEGLLAGDGDDALPLGAACTGAGACAGESGVVVCQDLVARCSATSAASPESCNAVDDDCDGAVDEDVDEDLNNAEVLSCLDEGVCSSPLGTKACVVGHVVCGYVVAPDYEPNETSCDGLDNDCDGQVDEGTAKLFTGALATSMESQPVDRARWSLTAAPGGPLLFGGLHRRPLEGGGLNGRPLNDLWRFEPDTQAWSRLAPAPVPLAGHAATWSDALQGLIVHGGYSVSVVGGGTGEIEGTDGMWLWRAETDTWHEVAQVVSDPTQMVGGRKDHSLTMTAGGAMVLHGGRDLGATVMQTWMGSVTEVADGAYECEWSVGDHQGAPRHGHSALFDDTTGRVVLVGGAAASAVGFAVALDATEGWMPLGDQGKTQPAPRRDAAVAMVDGIIVAVGGRSITYGDVLPTPLSDAWRYDTAADAWTDFTLPEGVPALGGAFITTHDGQWSLGGGDSGAPVSWRWTWRLDEADLSWDVPEAWSGLAPRTGATVVVEPESGQTWLMGGSRMPGGFPLMDVHTWLPEAGSWQPVVEGLSPTADSLDATRPGLVAASGVWSPVSEAVLLAGGRDVITGALSGALWSFDPGASDGEPLFVKLTAYGDVPPAVERPVFTVDTASTAWLAGRFMVEGQGGEEKAVVRIYSLDLSGYVWTLVWDGSEVVEGPGEVLDLAGGVGPDGLDLVMLEADGGAALWRFSTTTGIFKHVPLAVGEAPLTGLSGWSHDRHSQTVLLTAATNAGAALLVTHLGTGVVDTLPMDPAWPSSLTRVGMGHHPSAGALLVGGHDPGGYTTSAWHVAEQVCD